MALPYVHNPSPRKMPNETAIRRYWVEAGLAERKRHSDQSDFLEKGFCFACLWERGAVRAHIVARCDGGSDDVSNLHMLCKSCHNASEWIVGEDQYWRWFDERTCYDSTLESMVTRGVNLWPILEGIEPGLGNKVFEAAHRVWLKAFPS